MKLIEKILVVMDSNSDHQDALVKAIKMAEETSANIELFLVVYNSQFVSHWGFNQGQLDLLKKEYLASKLRWLETYVPEIKALDIIVNIDAVWHADSSCAILAKVAATEPSIVIKSTNQDSIIKKIFFTPSDWQLLEHCKVPLLLTKNTEHSYRKVMAAVKPDKDYDTAKKLDNEILQAALAMADLFDGETHVCHCYEPMDMELWQGMSAIGMDQVPVTENFEDYNDSIKQHHSIVFNNLLRDYAIDNELAHLVEGSALEEIPTLIDSNQIDLLVMGMSNKGKFIGNTIEKILDNIECDVLSIQSPDSED